MNANNFVRFQTPSQMSPAALEAIFVQREKLAERLVDKIVESATTDSKHHSLLVGPRGIGKTHLVSLVHHRVQKRAEVQGRLVVAWLREEAYSVASYIHLLLAILKAMDRRSDSQSIDEVLDQLQGMDETAQVQYAEQILLEAIGDRTLLVITENLEDSFDAIEREGQHKLRALIQNHPRFTVLATSQSLFQGVSVRESPFYGFFEVHRLERFSYDEALEMLVKIAELQGDSALTERLRTPLGRARVRAIDHLAAGSPRLYVMLSEFLGADSIDALVEPVLKLIENLTPYYQSRMQLISPQQRAMVEHLCEQEGAVPVKEVARGLLISQQTASSQFGKLRELGYVRAEKAGRETHYELQEPLMRMALAAKTTRAKPIRLFVEFLRRWFSENELEARKKRSIESGRPVDAEYAAAALDLCRVSTEDPLLKACLADLKRFTAERDFGRALQAAEELTEIQPNAMNWLRKARAQVGLRQMEEATRSLERAVEADPKTGHVWLMKAIVEGELNRWEDALASTNEFTNLEPDSSPGWALRGAVLAQLHRFGEAAESYKKSIRIDPGVAINWVFLGAMEGAHGDLGAAVAALDRAIEFDGSLALAWAGRAYAELDLDRLSDALSDATKALELDPLNSRYWDLQARILRESGKPEGALTAVDEAIRLDPRSAAYWVNRGGILESLHQLEDAVASFDRAVEIEPSFTEIWAERGFALFRLARWEEALQSFDRALESESTSNKSRLWASRGMAAHLLGRPKEALESYRHALKLDPANKLPWFCEGSCLEALGRYAEAIRSYDRAAENDADRIPAVIQGAALRVATGRPDEAEEMIVLMARSGAAGEVAKTLVATIESLRKEPHTERSRNEWVRLWKHHADEREEFPMALRMLEQAILYLNTGSPAALLALPQEQRSIVAPLVGWKENE
jgi:tetratricopeptide (TPR) repeat protein